MKYELIGTIKNGNSLWKYIVCTFDNTIYLTKDEFKSVVREDLVLGIKETPNLVTVDITKIGVSKFYRLPNAVEGITFKDYVDYLPVFKYNNDYKMATQSGVVIAFGAVENLVDDRLKLCVISTDEEKFAQRIESINTINCYNTIGGSKLYGSMYTIQCYVDNIDDILVNTGIAINPRFNRKYISNQSDKTLSKLEYALAKAEKTLLNKGIIRN